VAANKKIDEFLSNYTEDVVMNASKLRELLFERLPGIIGAIKLFRQK
jgi:hypothetical protein